MIAGRQSATKKLFDNSLKLHGCFTTDNDAAFGLLKVSELWGFGAVQHRQFSLLWRVTLSLIYRVEMKITLFSALPLSSATGLQLEMNDE